MPLICDYLDNGGHPNALYRNFYGAFYRVRTCSCPPAVEGLPAEAFRHRLLAITELTDSEKGE